jgi:ABC-2 type transport system permease protein
MATSTWLRTFYTAMVYDSKQTLHRSSLTSFVAYNCLHPVFFLLAAWVTYTILQSVGVAYFRGITGAGSYISYVIIGLALSGIIAQSAGGGFSAVKFEQWQGTIEPVFRTPASNYAWLTGKLVAGELFGFIPLITTLLFGYAIFGIHLASAPAIGAAALAIVLMLISMSVLATIFAGVSVLLRDNPSVLVTSFLNFFAGLVYPISILPIQAQWISWSLPSTYGVDVARKALLLGLGLGDSRIQLELLEMLAITLVLLPIGYLSFTRSIKAAEKSGRLDTG